MCYGKAMENTDRTTMLNVRVTPEFRGQLKRCAKEFGWSLKDIIIEGASMSMIDVYDRLLVDLRDLYANMKDGSRKDVQARMIGKAVADRAYFVAHITSKTAFQPTEFPGTTIEMSKVVAKA